VAFEEHAGMDHLYLLTYCQLFLFIILNQLMILSASQQTNLGSGNVSFWFSERYG